MGGAKLTKRNKVIIVVLIVTVVAWTWFFPSRPRVGPFPPLEAHEGPLLVFAPHSDDEMLAVGGLLQRAEAAGQEPKVVLVTAGDAFINAVRAERVRFFIDSDTMLAFGESRRQESERALGHLGLPPERLIFLGYPDQGLDGLWTTCWREACRGLYTREKAVPYGNARSPGNPYTGEALYNEIKEILIEERPAAVVYPHPNDAHTDHRALAAFISAALEELRRTAPDWQAPTPWLYLVHRGDWPAPKGYRPADVLLPPQKLAAGSLTEWYLLPLTEGEVERKGEAVKLYRSQVRVMPRYLHSFIRSNELFGYLPPARLVGEGPLVGGPPWEASSPWSLVLRDPKGDTIGRRLAQPGDLTEVWAAKADDRLYLAVRTVAPVHRPLTIWLTHRALGPQGWGDEARTTPTATRSNWVRYDLPLAEAVLFELESIEEGRRIDRTAWQLLITDEGDADVDSPSP